MFEKVYDRMEKGEINKKELELTEESIFNLNRFPNIVQLFGNKNNYEKQNIITAMVIISKKSELANYKMNVDVVSYSERK